MSLCGELIIELAREEAHTLRALLHHSATPALSRIVQRFELLERVERLEQFFVTTCPAVT